MNYIIAGFVVLCVLMYLFKKRLAWVMNAGVHAIFVLSVVGVMVSVFVSPVFTSLAELTLQDNGTLQTIQNIDSKISFDSVKNFFTGQQNKKEGVLEQQVYPSLVSSLAAILRGATFVVSIVFMVLSLYLSYLFAGTAETIHLERQIHDLEQRLTSVSNLVTMEHDNK